MREYVDNTIKLGGLQINKNKQTKIKDTKFGETKNRVDLRGVRGRKGVNLINIINCMYAYDLKELIKKLYF